MAIEFPEERMPEICTIKINSRLWLMWKFI